MRQPKPYFREFDGWWYVQLREGAKRKQVKLVKGRKQKEEAYRRYHVLMAERSTRGTIEPAAADSTVAILDAFLDWCQNNKAGATYDWYAHFLQSFADTIDEALSLSQLRPFHVTKWLDAQKWSATSKNDAAKAVRRAVNWSVEQGYIDRSPLAGMKVEKSPPRDKLISAEAFGKMVEHTRDERFRDLLHFLLNSGVRPQEARLIEARHYDVAHHRLIIERSQAKGKKHPRVIFLNDTAREIVERLVEKHPQGPLFRNTRGEPWTRNAIRCRFRQLEEKIGERFCAYNFRHTFVTNGLANGVDSITLAVLTGHADPSTIAKTYQHLAQRPEHLRSAVQRAVSGASAFAESSVSPPALERPQDESAPRRGKRTKRSRESE